MDTLYENQEIYFPEFDPDQPDLVHSDTFSQAESKISEIEQEVVPSSYAPSWPDGHNGQDCRPRLKDGDTTYLIDSGSMACVIPAEPGDKVDKTIGLKTVDGSPFACYGQKELNIKIGRKTYKIVAVKAFD